MNKEAGIYWHSSKQVTSTREEMMRISISSSQLCILPEPVVEESCLQQQQTNNNHKITTT